MLENAGGHRERREAQGRRGFLGQEISGNNFQIWEKTFVVICSVVFLACMEENQLTGKVISEAIDIHKELGPGLLEKVYVECLYYRLVKNGLQVIREQPIPVIFEEIKMECGYRADLIVERKLIIEVKSVEAIADVHIAQTLTYLKFAQCKLGLLINFNVTLLKDGIRRIINNR